MWLRYMGLHDFTDVAAKLKCHPSTPFKQFDDQCFDDEIYRVCFILGYFEWKHDIAYALPQRGK
jgi:hypothetical protein